MALLKKLDSVLVTSRRSLKLAYDGLRYLTKLKFGIARCSVGQRGILMEPTAPRLGDGCCVGHRFGSAPNVFERASMRVGLLVGDSLRILAGTSAASLPGSLVQREGVRGVVPAGSPRAVEGRIDNRGRTVDDTRSTLAIARTEVTEAAGDGVPCRREAHGRDPQVLLRPQWSARSVSELVESLGKSPDVPERPQAVVTFLLQGIKTCRGDPADPR